MDPFAMERQHKLYALAEHDPIYQVWAHSFRECQEDFVRFADTQPEDVRNFLYGYADCGRMMQQRLVNLACEHMIYPEEQSIPGG